MAAKLLRRAPSGVVNEHYDGDGAIIFNHACSLGCEGIMSKRLGLPYRELKEAAYQVLKKTDYWELKETAYQNLKAAEHARWKRIASGSNLTFESREGFPADSIRASLAHANWNLHYSQAR